MEVLVEHVFGNAIFKLYMNGWRIALPLDWSRILISMPDKSSLWLRRHRRLRGVEMKKEFASVGDAIRDFERTTGYDVVSEDEDICTREQTHVFWWDDSDGKKKYALGWECGKYLYEKWYDVPRKCLEELNAKKD